MQQRHGSTTIAISDDNLMMMASWWLIKRAKNNRTVHMPSSQVRPTQSHYSFCIKKLGKAPELLSFRDFDRSILMHSDAATKICSAESRWRTSWTLDRPEEQQHVRLDLCEIIILLHTYAESQLVFHNHNNNNTPSEYPHLHLRPVIQEEQLRWTRA